MKEYCLELILTKNTVEGKYHLMREYLQAYILKIMQEKKILQNWIFVGGTALRFIYHLPRYSEDLDFSLAKKKEFPFEDLMHKVHQELMLAGYSPEVVLKKVRTVRSAFFKFAGLMYEAGLSPLPGQKFAVKLELDSNPPQGAQLVTQTVHKFFPLTFLCYDLSSFLTGKLSAILSRKYTKGRDFYDLGWYLTRYPEMAPNIPFLQSALRQMEWKGPYPEEHNWREFVYDKVNKTDWEKVNKDVKEFLDNPKEMEVFTKENVLKLIKGE